MGEYKLFCLDNTELADFEATSRGYRGDIYVKVSSDFYHVYVYDITRLRQDFDTEIEYQSYYSIEPNIIIVREVSIDEIKFVISKLFLKDYFNNIKSIDISNSILKQLKIF